MKKVAIIISIMLIQATSSYSQNMLDSVKYYDRKSDKYLSKATRQAHRYFRNLNPKTGDKAQKNLQIAKFYNDRALFIIRRNRITYLNP